MRAASEEPGGIAGGGVATTGGDQLVLTGTRSGKPFRMEIDLPSVFSAEQNRTNDVLIQNGDVLWVDRAPLVYIYGEVQRPGPMRLERGMTLMQVLAAGGGLTQRGTERGIRVHRKAADGKVQVIQAPMDAGPVRMAVFDDTCGNLIQIVEMKAAA